MNTIAILRGKPARGTPAPRASNDRTAHVQRARAARRTFRMPGGAKPGLRELMGKAR